MTSEAEWAETIAYLRQHEGVNVEMTNNAVAETVADAVAYDTRTVGGYSGHTFNVLVTNFDGIANATAEEGRKRRRVEASDAESSTTTLDSSSNATRESAVEWVQLPRGPQGGARLVDQDQRSQRSERLFESASQLRTAKRYGRAQPA